jgi:hypothetical protein
MAWRAVFSSTPTPVRTWSNVDVQTGSPSGYTNSPRIVSSIERALPELTCSGEEDPLSLCIERLSVMYALTIMHQQRKFCPGRVC